MNYYTNNPIPINGQQANPHLSPSETTHVIVGPDEINAPTVALDHITTTHPRVPTTDAASQCIVGRTIYADADATLKNGETQRSVWGMNVVARVGPGENNDPTGKHPADDHCGIEMDLINEFQDAPEDVNAPGHSYGFWAQSTSATNRKNGTAFFGSDTGNGWINGHYIDARVYGWLGYHKTRVNAPTAKGWRIETQWADKSGTVLELAVADVTKFLVDGSLGIDTGVFMRVAGNLRELAYGPPDSAGPGYRVLRVAN